MKIVFESEKEKENLIECCCPNDIISGDKVVRYCDCTNIKHIEADCFGCWANAIEMEVKTPTVVTYGDIYKEFLTFSGIDENLVSDYRPYTTTTYGVEQDINNTIIIWLKNGGNIIYKAKERN